MTIVEQCDPQVGPRMGFHKHHRWLDFRGALQDCQEPKILRCRLMSLSIPF
jgi:hypothetical protein